MDSDYGAAYADLYRRHWWWRAREVAVLGELRRLRHGCGRTRILDVGCGDGLFLDALTEFGEPQGVEPDSSLISAATAAAGRVTNAPFDERFAPGERFGLILFLDVLEHLRDPVAALRHAFHLLDDDGTIVITVPAFRWLWTSHDDMNHHHTRYTRSELRQVVAAAGGHTERDRYLFQSLVPAKLLVRAMESVRQPAAGPPRVPPAPINQFMYGLALAEGAVTRAAPLPFGTSVLAVARAGSSEPGARDTAATSP